MRDAQSEIEAKGARLVVIGNGTTAMARDFLEEGRQDLAVYTDPSRKSYALLGFKRGRALLLHPGTVAAGVRAFAGGHRQIGIRGDPAQNGGVLVVGRAGTVHYHFTSRHPGDHPDVGEILGLLPGA